MLHKYSSLTTLLLTLLPAVLPAATATYEVDGGDVRAAWCSRVCPAETPRQALPQAPPQAPSSLPSLNLTCPEPRCPQPVCPVPQCPTPSCPSSTLTASQCPPCLTGLPLLSRVARATLPWKTLQTYNATHLGFYKAYPDKALDWFEAQMLCENEGAHLVIINSMEEDLFVRANLIGARGWIHVGVHDIIREGERMTVLGAHVSTTGFNKWLYGHIYSNPKSNCAWIKKTDSGMGMGPCSDKGPFVCEFSIGL